MNFLRSIVLVLSLVLAMACTKSGPELTNEKLAEVIADMHISEVSLQRQQATNSDTLREAYLLKLESIHGIDRNKIKEEVEGLMEDRKRHSEVYNLVIEKLQELEKVVKEKNNPANKNKNKVNG